MRLSAGPLRSNRLTLVGSGIGSNTPEDFAEELPAIATAIAEDEFDIRTRAVPLADVAAVWGERIPERIVFTP